MLLLSLLSLALVFLLLGLGFLSCSLHIWKVYFRRDLTLACCNIPFYKEDKSIKIKKRRQFFLQKCQDCTRTTLKSLTYFFLKAPFHRNTMFFLHWKGRNKRLVCEKGLLSSIHHFFQKFKVFWSFKFPPLGLRERELGRLMFARRANFHFLLRGSPLWMVWLTWNYFFQISLRPLLGLIMLSTHSLKRIVDASFIGRRICNCLQGGNLALSWIFF